MLGLYGGVPERGVVAFRATSPLLQTLETPACYIPFVAQPSCLPQDKNLWVFRENLPLLHTLCNGVCNGCGPRSLLQANRFGTCPYWGCMKRKWKLLQGRIKWKRRWNMTWSQGFRGLGYWVILGVYGDNGKENRNYHITIG